jgi:hypothetical protein
MMVALLLYAYCQGERPSRVIEKRCVRGVAYRVIAGGLHPDHATIARFRARHEKALGQLSLDGTKLAGNAAQKANRTLPEIEKILAEAAAAEDAREGTARSRLPVHQAERQPLCARGPGPRLLQESPGSFIARPENSCAPEPTWKTASWASAAPG